MNNHTGKVFLVGAGPGDPGLITVKGLELIRSADVIVFDQLGTAAFLDKCQPGCELIDVGKFSGNHKVPQDEINEILVEKAKEGKKVVRLKGGDPFVFGRGGEELQRLSEEGIDFEVVPGITSAISAPAYAGIPVTHRDYTSTLAIVTGHEADKESSAIDWQALAGIGTLVFLMGVKKLPDIARNLIEHGKNPKTPAALIQHGTLPIQKTVVGTLDTIVDVVKHEGIKAPAVTIIGDTVNLREHLRWFEKKPLFGRKIVVTRSRHQASNLLEQLKELGADAIEFPTIRIVQHLDNSLFNEFMQRFDKFSCLVFTSVNGVEGFIESLINAKKDLRALGGKKIICIGPATAKAFIRRGIIPDFVPKTYVAESLLPYFAERKPAKVALLRAEKARETLPKALEQIGYEVEIFPVYHTEYENTNNKAVINLLESERIDLVTFTSSSTVEGFYRAIENSQIDPESIPAAVIGPITEETAKEKKFNILCRAEEYTIPGLINAIVKHFAKEKSK
ncbi:MAG: uroporphyrinogen-III C-methyltransferase [Candidatus Rifleibacteriota bacterium]